jgi:hypothetical protein
MQMGMVSSLKKKLRRKQNISSYFWGSSPAKIRIPTALNPYRCWIPGKATDFFGKVRRRESFEIVVSRCSG